MSNNVDFIPPKDADFSQWLNSFYPYLVANCERFNVPLDAVNRLQPLISDWNTKYAIAEAPATRTRATVREKTEAHGTLEKAVRNFIKEYLAFNHSVSDADRDNMGLPVHKTTRTPIPAPTSVPDFMPDSSVIRRITVHFRDNGSTSNAKPAGVHGAEIRWGILDTPPANIDALTHSAFDTRTPFTLEFDESDRGKSVYFCLRWENSKGDKGPWSEIMMAIVP
jgi:hypothetical protein